MSSLPKPAVTCPVRTLTEDLVRRRSVSPDDAGCQTLLADRLAASGFICESMRFGDVDNLWAVRDGGQPGPLFVFAGHTDVVPAGPRQWWHADPFEPTEREGMLLGRGVADMKSSLAAMVVAIEAFLSEHPVFAGSIGMLLTSDEEGPAVDGTVKVVQALQERGLRIQHCIVGEPTSQAHLGDMIKNGRRGSLNARLTVKGIQGHIAYPHLARNPVHQLAPALAALVAERWDEGNAYFPATSWQVANLNAGTGASNVIPGEAVMDFNFRFCTESTVDSLKKRVHALLDAHGLEYDIDWKLSGLPFLTPRGPLTDAISEAIKAETGLQTELSTTGGTSDGRFLAAICDEVIEFGPPNATIHKSNESIPLDCLKPLSAIFRRTLDAMLA
ncbi:MAG: succinyl-diaminopimelate desuccinylase [Burkholderiaceae bacterium]